MTFGEEIAKWCEGSKTRTNLVIRKTGLEIFRRVVKRTPVDQGRARSNWFFTVDGPSSQTTDSKDTSKEGDSTVNRETSNALKFDCFKNDALYITNNMPYISVLEYGGYPNPPLKGTRIKSGDKVEYVIKSAGGYSKQAPAGMVRVTLAEIDDILNKAVKD